MAASYFHVQDFLNQYRHESAATAKLLSSISEAHADAEPNPAIRSTRRLAWHLAKTPGNFGKVMGLDITTYTDADKPDTVAGIAEAFQKSASEFIAAVEQMWGDGNLSDEVQFFGMNMTKGIVLYMLVAHEIHHRGQMQIIMRMVGDVPVGVIGPTQEEEVAMRAAATATA